eukprot:6185780-Pleurochrysis_carterae.AAC.7
MNLRSEVGSGDRSRGGRPAGLPVGLELEHDERVLLAEVGAHGVDFRPRLPDRDGVLVGQIRLEQKQHALHQGKHRLLALAPKQRCAAADIGLVHAGEERGRAHAALAQHADGLCHKLSALGGRERLPPELKQRARGLERRQTQLLRRAASPRWIPNHE